MKVNIVTTILLLTAVATAGTAMAALPVVENVSFWQETDGGRQVFVYYDLFDNDGDSMAVTLRASADGGVTWDLSCDTVFGHVGPGILSGTNKLIVWYLGTDHPEYFSDQVLVRVLADDGVPAPFSFTNYIAIGNSLTAGYMDGGLHMTGQNCSYPQLIANAMGYPADSFVQPLIAPPGIGTSAATPGYVAGVLCFDGAGISVLGETAFGSVHGLLMHLAWPVPYSNLGVPGATTHDVLHCTSSANSQSPYNSFFNFILRNPIFGDMTMLDQAINRGPTLVTCWIGYNDILGGATSGEPEVGWNITPTAVFTPKYESILDRIADDVIAEFGWAPVIITANIPPVFSAPYFMPQALFEEVIGTAYAYEEAPSYVLLPALTYALGGGQPPLPAFFTLDPAEVALVETVVDEYNAAIATASAERSIMVYDVNAELAGLDPLTEAAYFLFLLDGVGDIATAAALTEYSLDGIHPNSHGYAIVAQGFLDLINGEFGTSFTAQTDLVWDPTYGMPVAATGTPMVTSEAAAAMTNLFQKTNNMVLHGD